MTSAIRKLPSALLQVPPDEAAKRTCNDCGMCCTLYPIPELGKLAGEPCQHLTADKRCGIYETRPATCAAFRCWWLDGVGGETEHPSQIRAVLTTQNTCNGLALFLAAEANAEGRAPVAVRNMANAIATGGQLRGGPPTGISPRPIFLALVGSGCDPTAQRYAGPEQWIADFKAKGSTIMDEEETTWTP